MTRTDDGEGGFTTAVNFGDFVSVALVKKSESNPIIADKEDVSDSYVATFPKGSFGFHDYFVRVDDGRLFRIITEDPDLTPDCATFDFEQRNAELCDPEMLEAGL